MTDHEIDCVFNMLNASQINDIFFSYKTPDFLCADIKENIHKKPRSNKDGTAYISNPMKQGYHWTLLVIDVEENAALYCDSKGWPIPSNICEKLVVM